MRTPSSLQLSSDFLAACMICRLLPTSYWADSTVSCPIRRRYLRELTQGARPNATFLHTGDLFHHSIIQHNSIIP